MENRYVSVSGRFPALMRMSPSISFDLRNFTGLYSNVTKISIKAGACDMTHNFCMSFGADPVAL